MVLQKKNSDLCSLDKKVKTFKCDLTKKNDLKNLKRKLQSLNFKWDLIFSAVGTTEPIGPFFFTPFQRWHESFNSNFLGQVLTIHHLYNLKNNKNSNICFLLEQELMEQWIIIRHIQFQKLRL